MELFDQPVAKPLSQVEPGDVVEHANRMHVVTGSEVVSRNDIWGRQVCSVLEMSGRELAGMTFDPHAPERKLGVTPAGYDGLETVVVGRMERTTKPVLVDTEWFE